MSKTATTSLTRNYELLLESNVAPELADIPRNLAGGTQIAVFLMPTQPDPCWVGRNETGRHPLPAVHGHTRSHECRPADIDLAAPVAIFITPDAIHIGALRNDDLWWAIRGRPHIAAEDGRSIV